MPLFWLSLAFLAGILLSDALGLPLIAWLVAEGGCLLLIVLRGIVSRRLPALSRLPLLLPALLALSLGAARYQGWLPEITPKFIAWYNDLNLEFVVEGVIAAPVGERDTCSLARLKVERLRPLDDLRFSEVQGMLSTRLLPRDWQYGDRLRLEGRIVTPAESEEFSYRDYLARQGIHSQMLVADTQRVGRGNGSSLPLWIYCLRARAVERLYRLFPDPEASLLAGILLGIEGGP